MISSYVGENAEFERQYLSGELEVELTPQVGYPGHCPYMRSVRTRLMLILSPSLSIQSLPDCPDRRKIHSHDHVGGGWCRKIGDDWVVPLPPTA